MSSKHLDVIIVGAGLSGIGAAVHLQRDCPKKTYAILESRQAVPAPGCNTGVDQERLQIVKLGQAEALQHEDQPEFPLLYSLGGFRYCDLLLAPAEPAAWRQPPWTAAALLPLLAASPAGVSVG